jgi:nitrogen fixation protein FixH
MRVRPVFWIFFGLICVSILLFAQTISAQRLMPMQVHVEQISTTASATTIILLSLTDSDGVPIDQATITSAASMPTMHHPAQPQSSKALGQGKYLAQVALSMDGVWNIVIRARADGFSASLQAISVTL